MAKQQIFMTRPPKPINDMTDAELDAYAGEVHAAMVKNMKPTTRVVQAPAGTTTVHRRQRD